MPERSPNPLLSLVNDAVLKLYFCAPERKHLLLDFVNTMLRLETPIASLNVTNPEVTPELVRQKGVILDIRAVTSYQEPIHIEVQSRSDPDFLQRAFYYGTRLHGGQLVKGGSYQELRPTYSINILNFNHFQGTDPHRFARVLTMLDRETAENYGPLMELHFFELPKFRKFMRKNRQGSGHRHLDNWLQLLLNPADNTMERAMRTDPMIKDAMKHLTHISGDVSAQELARMREVAEHEIASLVGHAQAKGEAKGEAKGLAKGRAEGATEAKLKILESLLASSATASLPNTELARIVDLSAEEVAQVRARHKDGRSS